MAWGPSLVLHDKHITKQGLYVQQTTQLALYNRFEKSNEPMIKMHSSVPILNCLVELCRSQVESIAIVYPIQDLTL